MPPKFFNINFFLSDDTFALIGRQIFENLDHEDLLDCKLVCKSWLNFIIGECQKSTIIIQKEIRHHVKKFNKVVAKRSHARFYLDEEAKSLLGQCASIKARRKSLHELRPIQWISRKFLPISKTDIKMSANCLNTFLSIDPERLLEFGRDQNPLIFQAEFESVQYYAAKADNFKLVKEFAIFSGTFNPRACYLGKNATALHDITFHISNEMKKYIAKHATANDVNPKMSKVEDNDKCHTPLHTAAQTCNFELFMMIAKKIENKINVKDEDGKTPYDYYVEADSMMAELLDKPNRELLKYLVEHSENPNPRNSLGYTPLLSAAAGLDLVAFRIIASKVPDAKEHIKDLDHDFTPLWWALVDNDMESIINAVKATKDSNHWIVTGTRTLFQEIIDEDRVDILEALDCHDINIRPLPYNLFINISDAALDGNFEMFKLLCKGAFVCQGWLPEPLPKFQDQYHMFEWFSTLSCSSSFVTCDENSAEDEVARYQMGQKIYLDRNFSIQENQQKRLESAAKKMRFSADNY